MSDKMTFQRFSPTQSAKPIGGVKRFELDHMIANVGHIMAFCQENECEANAKFERTCAQILQSARFIYKIAGEFFLGDLTENGFVTFLRLFSAYTNQIVQQIRTENRIDPDFMTFFKLFPIYSDILHETYVDLKSEREADARNSQVSNCRLHVRRKGGLQNDHVYRFLSE